jgi:hypothetical protein
MSESRLGPKTLRVIIRNDAPMVFCNDSPSYRSVEIELTPDQQAKLELQWCGSQCGTQIYESISNAFFDDPIAEVKR